MSAKAVLIAARELLAPEGGWGQHAYNHWADGKACAPYCASGAIDVIAGYTAMDPYERMDDAWSARNRLDPIIHPFQSLPAWNDKEGRTQAEVLAAFDKAIAACGVMA